MRSSLSQQLLQQLKAREFVRPGDRVGVAVSGGADSVALLLLLLELRRKLGIVLSVVHFNHKLRGKASDADRKFVTKLALKHGLEFHSASAEVAKKARKERANLEDAARRARYDYFRTLADSGACTRIAVAHSADDQAETVLAHILRGTGLAGLGGIHPVAPPIFRPLLTFRRTELRAYLRQKKQTWREDATNQDTRRMRARIRKKLIPLLERQFQPALVDHLATLANLARADEAYLEALVDEGIARIAKKRENEVRVALADLLPAEKKKLNTESSEKRSTEGPGTRAGAALGQRMARRIVEDLKRPGAELGAKHLARVMELARKGPSGKELILPGGVEVRRERDALLFRSRPKTGTAPSVAAREFSYNIDLYSTQLVPVPKLRCAFRFRVIDWPSQRGETTSRETVLDRELLRPPLLLRNWRPGDRLHPLGHRHAHKLKRLLNERRISRWEREGWPVLTSGGILAWARGFRAAAEFAAMEKTRVGFVIAEEPL